MMYLAPISTIFYFNFSQWSAILDQFSDLMNSLKISFVRSSGGIVGEYYFRIVEKGQIYDKKMSTALSNKNKAFLSIKIGRKIWNFAKNWQIFIIKSLIFSKWEGTGENWVRKKLF